MTGAKCSRIFCASNPASPFRNKPSVADTSLLDGSNHFGDVFFYLKDIMMLAAHLDHYRPAADPEGQSRTIYWSSWPSFGLDSPPVVHHV